MTRTLDVIRVLLGAALMLAALDYFLPSLLPFWPDYAWQDPMSQRLMSEFDRSGLLAVAKFILLAGGALLIVNRAVPFALTAMMTVNVCGTYISLFVEGDPVIAVLAILVTGLNALLMFAYLPWYSGVLEGRQLADGEEPEDGGNYESLYVNPLGNASLLAYLGAALVLAAAAAFYWFVVPGLNSTTGLVTLAIPAVLLAAGWLRSLGRRKGA